MNDHLQTLGLSDPSSGGSSEYRAIWDILSDAIKNEPASKDGHYATLVSITEEFISQARNIIRILKPDPAHLLGDIKNDCESYFTLCADDDFEDSGEARETLKRIHAWIDVAAKGGASARICQVCGNKLDVCGH